MAALAQTMTGQTIAPDASTPPPQSPSGSPTDPTQEQSMIQSWYDDLNKRLSSIPNVDVAAKMQPLIDQARAQKVPSKMSPLAAGLAAFGAPQLTPQIIEHNQQIEEAQRQKDAQLLRLQETIIGSQIDKDMQEGKFKQALEQSRTLQMMKPQLDAADRAAALKDFQDKEALKQKGRLELATARGTQARQTLTERAKQLTKGLSIDEKLLLAQVSHISKMQELAANRAATYDPLSQAWTVNPTDWDAITASGNDSLEQWINAHKGGSGTAPKPATPAKSLSAQDRIRAAAGK